MAPVKKINIRRDVSDQYYRYKMQPINAKIEGKGNGIKTVITNLKFVGEDLDRAPANILKYFGFELGAQTSTDATGRCIINGAHAEDVLQDGLDGFIAKFVLCKNCLNPETEMSFPENRIVLKCKACGQRSDVDMGHKLSSFILKSVPKKGKNDKATKKAERKARKEREQNGNGDDGSPGGSPNDSHSDHAEENGDVELEAGSDDELTRRINSEAKQIEVEETKEIEWTIDTSEAAVKARAMELSDDFKKSLVVNEDDEEEEGGHSVYDQLGSWILKEGEEKGGVGKVQDVDIYLKAKELGIEKKHRTLTVLAQTIFDEDIVKQIDARASMLQTMITSDRHQKAFLGGTERFVGKEKPQLMRSVTAIMMKYYKKDLVTEEVFKAWGSKASKKYVDRAISKKVHQSAEPFLQWLDTAEEEEEDSDTVEEEKNSDDSE